ncbi:MAG: hypothetical protein P8049_05045 [Gemmatimonadota bacterium]
MRSIFARRASACAAVSLLALAVHSRADAQEIGPRVGEVSFPNSGAPGAQADFLVGLALLHSFEYPEARARFRAARQIDPGFAMAYWGEAMAWNYSLWFEQNADSARAVLGRLGDTPEARIASAPTERERAWLGAVEALYGEGTKQQRDDAYAESMAELHGRFPEDPEAGAFHALALLGTAHEGRDHAIYMRAGAIAGEVFAAHPSHPGAAHYMIHSFDDPVHAPLGLRAARAYSRIAPDADHAQHMTTHIFLALGLWEEVVRANERADAVVDRDRAAAGRPPSFCGHYNEWLLYGYLMEDRTADALNLLQGCRDATSSGSDRMAASFSDMRSRYVVDSGDPGGSARAMRVDYGDRVGPQFRDAWLDGYVAGRAGDATATASALERVRELRPLAEEEMAGEGFTDLAYSRRPEVLEMQIEGLYLLALGREAAGLERIGEAAALEGELPLAYGPPAVDKPSHELLGELLLEAGRPAEARAYFETALSRTPGRIPAVLGLERTRAGSAATGR